VIFRLSTPNRSCTTGGALLLVLLVPFILRTNRLPSTQPPRCEVCQTPQPFFFPGCPCSHFLFTVIAWLCPLFPQNFLGTSAATERTFAPRTKFHFCSFPYFFFSRKTIFFPFLLIEIVRLLLILFSIHLFFLCCFQILPFL